MITFAELDAAGITPEEVDVEALCPSLGAAYSWPDGCTLYCNALWHARYECIARAMIKRSEDSDEDLPF